MFSHASAAFRSPVACVRRREPPTSPIEARDSNSMACSLPRPLGARCLGLAHQADTSCETWHVSSPSRPGSMSVVRARTGITLEIEQNGHLPMAAISREIIGRNLHRRAGNSKSFRTACDTFRSDALSLMTRLFPIPFYMEVSMKLKTPTLMYRHPSCSTMAACHPPRMSYQRPF